jgi:hypothetical protein
MATPDIRFDIILTLACQPYATETKRLVSISEVPDIISRNHPHEGEKYPFNLPLCVNFRKKYQEYQGYRKQRT